MAGQSPQILAIHHIVHEYVNFVSSAELTIHGRDKNLNQGGINSPLNHHVSHAFYLNCRKLADFFQNKTSLKDDVLALHFVSGHSARLPVFEKWRDPINKQLAHITYFRDTGAREIGKQAQKDLYRELMTAWSAFRAKLPPEYADAVRKELAIKKLAPEFLGLPLGV